jgi:hypothetical protein
MPSLFSDLSFLWSAKAIARSIGRVSADLFRPFEVLHCIHWSAPWQERAGTCGRIKSC